MTEILMEWQSEIQISHGYTCNIRVIKTESDNTRSFGQGLYTVHLKNKYALANIKLAI